MERGVDILKTFVVHDLFSFKCLYCLVIWWDWCITMWQKLLDNAISTKKRVNLKELLFI